MSDLADLLKELEQVAKDTNLKEVKKEPLEESVTSKDDVSSLFEGLEAAYTESKIEEEIKNRLSEEDEQKLNAFSGFMQSVTELTNKPDSNKSIEDLLLFSLFLSSGVTADIRLFPINPPPFFVFSFLLLFSSVAELVSVAGFTSFFVSFFIVNLSV